MERGESSYLKYVEGDEEAFSEVLKTYFNNLTLFINGYLNDVYASEDVAIDTMLELIVHKKRFDFRSSLKTYLFAIGRHKALNYLKKHRRTLPIPPDEGALSDLDSLEREVIAGERKRAVMKALGELPDEMRSAVHLVYIEGMSYREAAAVLKKNEKQIDNLLARAKKLMRVSIETEKGDIL